MIHPTRFALAFALAVALALSTGCVRKDLHQAALDSIAEAQDQLSSRQGALEACQADLQASQAHSESLNGVIDECKAELLSVQAARDEVLADNQALRARLSELGEDVSALAQEKSTISRLLAEAERALEEARARQAAAEARNAIFRQLKARLQAMIDAGKLNVRIVRGRMVIDLKQDILFPSGSADLSEVGVETLTEVSQALAEFPDRVFQVEGHTDNVPIKTARFPTNWELSSARALSVVKLFADSGMNPKNLSAAGYGEFQPRADNGSPDGRALNRRIEVAMLPDLQLLPDIVDSLE